MDKWYNGWIDRCSLIYFVLNMTANSLNASPLVLFGAYTQDKFFSLGSLISFIIIHFSSVSTMHIYVHRVRNPHGCRENMPKTCTQTVTWADWTRGPRAVRWQGYPDLLDLIHHIPGGKEGDHSRHLFLSLASLRWNSVTVPVVISVARVNPLMGGWLSSFTIFLLADEMLSGSVMRIHSMLYPFLLKYYILNILLLRFVLV